MAIYGYCRVSTALQASEGESLDVQRRMVEGWAHMQGAAIDGMFIERGVSGSVPVVERPEGRRLLGALKPGDTVVSAKLDRLFRSALDALQMVAEFKGRGVSLVLLDLGGDISGNGLSKLFLTIAAAFAEAERDRIRERIGQVKQDQRNRGRYLGGKPPFGFRVGTDGALIEHPEEQVAIGRILALRETGKPYRAIQSALRDDGTQLSLDAIRRIVLEHQSRHEAGCRPPKPSD